ncbi:acyl carrier protein [Caulobacter sp.]|uniref:acyl carrier protein n=1 Tax=Caulobacter sp. TaxID=78 RepID=UPI003BAB58BC
MAPAHDFISEKTLLTFAARAIGPLGDGICRTHRLDALDISTFDFMALVGALEDRCGVVLADCELARCETLGDLIERLRALAAPSGPAPRDPVQAWRVKRVTSRQAGSRPALSSDQAGSAL